VGEVPVCQTPANGKYLGRIDLDLSGERPKVKGWELIELSKAVPEDKAIADLVGRYSKEITGKYKKVIGRAESTLSLGEGGQTSLGTVVAEAVLEATGAQAAFINSSGIRAPIKKGLITLRDVVTTLPFPNKLVVLTMKGSELMKALSYGVNGRGAYPQVAGMTLDADGKRLKGVSIGEGPIEPGMEYRIATLDFLLLGGSGYTMLKKIPEQRREMTDIVVSEAFADYVAKYKVLK